MLFARMVVMEYEKAVASADGRREETLGPGQYFLSKYFPRRDAAKADRTKPVKTFPSGKAPDGKGAAMLHNPLIHGGSMIATLTLAALLAAPAAAQTGAAPKTDDKPAAAAESTGAKACRADIKRFCKDVKPGEGRVGACLKANVKKLSKACRRWAAHGGPGHLEDALTADIDGVPAKPAEPK